MTYAKEEGQAVSKESQEDPEEEGREEECQGKKGSTETFTGFYSRTDAATKHANNY